MIASDMLPIPCPLMSPAANCVPKLVPSTTARGPRAARYETDEAFACGAQKDVSNRIRKNLERFCLYARSRAARYEDARGVRVLRVKKRGKRVFVPLRTRTRTGIPLAREKRKKKKIPRGVLA